MHLANLIISDNFLPLCRFKKQVYIMIKIVFATGNSGKLREASEILGEGYELVTPASFGITEDILKKYKIFSNNKQKYFAILETFVNL